MVCVGVQVGVAVAVAVDVGVCVTVGVGVGVCVAVGVGEADGQGQVVTVHPLVGSHAKAKASNIVRASTLRIPILVVMGNPINLVRHSLFVRSGRVRVQDLHKALHEARCAVARPHLGFYHGSDGTAMSDWHLAPGRVRVTI